MLIVDSDTAIFRYRQFVLLISAIQNVLINNEYYMTIPLTILIR